MIKNIAMMITQPVTPFSQIENQQEVLKRTGRKRIFEYLKMCPQSIYRKLNVNIMPQKDISVDINSNKDKFMYNKNDHKEKKENHPEIVNINKKHSVQKVLFSQDDYYVIFLILLLCFIITCNIVFIFSIVTDPSCPGCDLFYKMYRIFTWPMRKILQKIVEMCTKRSTNQIQIVETIKLPEVVI